MWQVFGFDTFEHKRYQVLPKFEFGKEAEAREVVQKKLEEILWEQPAELCGDPFEDHSMQDLVILVHPDGTEEVFNTNDL